MKHGTVTFNSDIGYSVVMLLDAASPNLTDGFGGWEVVDRPKRVGMTRFKGVNPFRQDIAVIFDGWRSKISQEQQIRDLTRMGVPFSDLDDPPKISLEGQALRTDLTWVIDSIDWDNQNTIWEMQSGIPVRLRQAAVIHLLEYVDEAILVTPASPAVRAAPKKPAKVVTVTAPDGMTLKQLAMTFLGDPDKWMTIIQYNPTLTADPRIVIKAGTYIAVPPGSFVKTPFFKVP